MKDKPTTSENEKRPEAGRCWLGLPVGVVLLLFWGLAPLLTLFLVYLWAKPHYQFFPLALAGAGFLAWTRFSAIPRPLMPGNRIWVALFLVVSLALLAGAVLFFSPWLACFAGVLCAASLLLNAGGWSVIRALVPALVVALTIIPPPMGRDTWLILELRALAVAWSSRLLDSLGVVHLLSGNVIELPQQKLLVEEACSGINSVLLTLSVCLFYLLWRRRSLWWILVVLLSVLSSVVLGNVVRITLGALLKYRYGIDILSGWKHELAGLVLLALYLVLIVSLDQFLIFLTSPMWEATESSLRQASFDRQSDSGKPLQNAVACALETKHLGHRPSSPWWTWATAAGFGVMGLLQLWLVFTRLEPLEQLQMASESHLRPGASFSLPEELDGWKRMQSDTPVLHKIETVGIFSHIWNYRRDHLALTVALDYPFRGYHEVTECYRVSGWTLTRLTEVRATSTNDPIPFSEVEMEKGMIYYGALWNSTLDERGSWMQRPASVPDRLLLRVTRRLFSRWRVEEFREPASYRIQVLVTGYSHLLPAEREVVMRFFEAVRPLLARQVLDQLQGTRPNRGGGR